MDRRCATTGAPTLIARRENDEQLLAAVHRHMTLARCSRCAAAAPPGAWTKSWAGEAIASLGSGGQQLAAVLSGDDTSAQSSLRLGEMLRVAGDHARAVEVFERCGGPRRARRHDLGGDHRPRRSRRLPGAPGLPCSMPTRVAPWPRPSWSRASPTMCAPSCTTRWPNCTNCSAWRKARAPCRTGARRLGLRHATTAPACARRCWPANLSPIEPSWMRLCHRRDSAGGLPLVAAGAAGLSFLPEAMLLRLKPSRARNCCGLPREVTRAHRWWFNPRSREPRHGPVLRPRDQRREARPCPSPSPAGCSRAAWAGRPRRAVHAELPQFVAALYGILRADAVVVLVNPMNRAEEFGHYITDPEAKVTICSADLAGIVARPNAALPRRSACSVLVTRYADALPASIVSAAEAPNAATEQWLRADPPLPESAGGLAGRAGRRPWPSSACRARRTAGPDDLALLPHTSGTTGLPKGCMHTHLTLMHNAVGQQWGNSGPESVALGWCRCSTSPA